jgi:zinc protease
VLLVDEVRLPEVRIAWPAGVRYDEDDASLEVLARILTAGRSSRLYQRIIYDEPLAQTATASQFGDSFARIFQIIVRGRPEVGLDSILSVVDEEIDRIQREPPTLREVERAINNIEATYVRQNQSALTRAERLSLYTLVTGDPGYLDREIAAYRAVTPESVQRVARSYLGSGRTILSVVPAGQLDLQVSP